MIERSEDLQGRLQRARTAVESLADRAAVLRSRVKAEIDARAAAEAVEELKEVPTRRVDGPFAASLERLETPPVRTRDLGEDGDYVSDSWEIALIEEEGK